MKVTVWNENIHEKQLKDVAMIYPKGIHGCIADFLGEDTDITVVTKTFDMEEHGLTTEVLDNTDVLVYWSHCAQEEFSDEIAERIKEYVHQGMGLVALHSAHFSKMMKKLLGTSMSLRWQHDERERLFVTAPKHPIAQGIPSFFELPQEEMYGEFFDIPTPDEVIFTGWFSGGEVFRSGCTFTRGKGRIFYFQPGHETYPVYYNPVIQRVIKNAVHWCAGEGADNTSETMAEAGLGDCIHVTTPLEKPAMKLSVFYEHLREAAVQSGKTMEELLDFVKSLNIQGIEMEYSTMVQIQENFLPMLLERDLEISNMYEFFDFENGLEGLKKAHEMLQSAKQWNVKRVMIIPGFLSQAEAELLNPITKDYESTKVFMDNSQAIQNMIAALREIVKEAYELGIFVSMEDFDGVTSPIARMQELRYFMERVPGLYHTLDLGNYIFSGEDIKEAYELLKPYILHVHCKDRGRQGEDYLVPVPVGKGYLPIQELVGKLKQHYQGYLAIEHFGAEDQIQFIKESAAFLHSCK